MTIQEILNTAEHRPWKIPAEQWKFYQEWNNAIFLHWQVELSELKKFIPNELIDAYIHSLPKYTFQLDQSVPIRPKVGTFHTN